MLNSLNLSLLSLFATNDRFGNDTTSLRRRFQTLALIYVNLLATSVIILYSILMWLLYQNPNPYSMFVSCFPLSLLSFYFIRKKKLDCATVALILVLHISNLILSSTTNCPLAALYGVLVYPSYVFSMSSSLKIHVLNSTLCILDFLYNSSRVNEIFDITLSQEQSQQISSSLFTCFLAIGTASSLAIVNKFLETQVWNLANENYNISQNLNQEVLQSMEAKDLFVSMVSHEIRNPLNALKGSVDYLLKVVKESEHLHILKRAKLGGEVLLNLVNNVLDAAKLKSDKMEITCIETDFLDIVKKVFMINSENLQDKKLFAEAFVDSNLPKFLFLDPSRILQILMNLLSNAIKFTPVGGKIDVYIAWCENIDNTPIIELGKVPTEVHHNTRIDRQRKSQAPPLLQQLGSTLNLQEMSHSECEIFMHNVSSVSKYQFNVKNDLNDLPAVFSRSPGNPWAITKIQLPHHNNNQSRGFLKVQIIDNGCGIDSHELPKLFGMFEQAREHPGSVHGGTGLGLWICKQLCQKMSGDITVDSKKNQGTSFVFSLPIEMNNQKATAAAEKPSCKSTKKIIKALVVDDYASNRYLYRILLQQQGIQVTTACDGKEALEKYKGQGNDPYSFILMDVNMPIMDGFVAAKMIREWENKEYLEKTDIYFITGDYFSEEDVMKSFKNTGGNYNNNIKFLKKPVDVAIIEQLVKRYAPS